MTFPQIVGAEAVVLAAVAAISVAVDRRYRARRAAQRTTWQRTAERFTDPATGDVIEVWYDPQSGARDYRRAGTSAP